MGKGLKGAPQYNGMSARVEGFRADGRCEVLLMQSGGKMKELALKVENLTAAPKREVDDRQSQPPEAQPRRQPACATEGDSGAQGEPLPSEEDLKRLSAKDLRKILM